MGSSSVGARFGTVVTAMVTPFSEDGALDVDGAVTLARWLTAHGSDGLVLAGTTGEGSVLSDEEKLSLWETVASAVSVPVLAGTGSNDTAHSVALTRRASTTGVAGALVVTPYYNRPSQRGLEQHFGAVADATSLPVMLYDIPVRSGRKIDLTTTLTLARRHPNVVAVKDASGDLVSAARLVAEAPAGFEVYSGDDVATLPLLAVGAVGVVSVSSHWIGLALKAMVGAFRSGRVEEARARHASLLDAMAFQSSERYPNPLPAKAVCRALGLPAGQCRLPMGACGPELDAEAERLVASLRADGLLPETAWSAAPGAPAGGPRG
jgi:4-hydroxy-tetrahydrodipicolinate synthase